MGRGVMHIGGQPDGVADAPALDERQQPGNFDLATTRRAVIAIGDRLPAGVALRILAVADLQADRHVARDHLPDRTAPAQAITQPGKLRFAQKCRFGIDAGLQVGGIRAAIAAHVDHEHIEQRTIRELAIDTRFFVLGMPAHRRVLEKRPRRALGQQGHALFGIALVGHEVF